MAILASIVQGGRREEELGRHALHLPHLIALHSRQPAARAPTIPEYCIPDYCIPEYCIEEYRIPENLIFFLLVPKWRNRDSFVIANTCI